MINRPSHPSASLNSVWQLLVGYIPNLHDIEFPSMLLRWRCPIYVGTKVNLLLIEFNSIAQSSTANQCPPRNLFQAVGLIAKPNRVYDASLVVVRLQSESIGEVAAVVIARSECKPEGLGDGDEF